MLWIDAHQQRFGIQFHVFPELRTEDVIITCFLQAIEKVKTDKNDKPYTDVKILNVTVTKS